MAYTPSIMAKMKYTLRESPLEHGGAFAKITPNGVADLDTLARHIVTARGSRYSEETVTGVVAELRQAALHYLAHGIRVNLSDLLELFPVYRRRFRSVTERIGSDTSGLGLGCRVSRSLTADLRRRVSMEYDERPPSLLPYAADFEDLSSGRRNARLTPGGIGTVRGQHLKADLRNPDEGVFFVARAGGKEVQVTRFSRNTPTELTFQNPALTPGAVYRLEVRVRPRHVKTLRTCRLSKTLTCHAG